VRRVAAAWWQVPAAILLAAVTWRTTSLLAEAGLDNSWEQALHLTWTRGVHFGTGFAWTYGPLGFLAFPRAVDGGTLAAAVLFVALVQICLCYLLLRRGAPVFTAPLAVLLVYLVVGLPLLTADIPLFIVLVLAVAALEDPEGRAGRWFPLAGGVAAGVAGLIKVNTGAAAVAIALVASVALAVAGNRRAAATVGVMLVTFVAGWLVCGDRVGDIPEWARLSASLVSGYSAAMEYERPGSGGHDYLIAAVMLALLLAIVVRRGLRLDRAYGIALVLIGAGFGFTLFKEGFVRHDADHTAPFFAAVALGCVVFAGRDLTRLAAGAAVALAIVVTHHSATLQDNPVSSARRATTQLVDVTLPGRRHDLVAGSRSDEQRSYAVPPRLLAELRGHTVHDEPFETAVVSAYGLPWRPLPILQAYSAYTSLLDEHNASFLRTARAPERILRENTATVVNGRSRELEAPAELRALICNDVQIGVSRRWQVLAHVPSRCASSRRLGTVDTAPGAPVPVPEGDPNELVIARVHVGDTVGNKLRGLVYKPHVPSISLGGGPFVPFVAATGGDGIVMHVPAAAGFDPRFGGALDWTTIAVGGRPGRVRIDFDAVPVSGAVPAPAGERSRQPLPAFRLANVDHIDRIRSPRGAVMTVAPGGGFLDYAYQQGPSLVVRGWGADAAAGVPASLILVYADGKLVFAGPPNTARPDVAAALGHRRLRRAGFTLLVPARAVRAGDRRRHVRVFSVVGDRALELAYPPSYGWR
jgi:hypothetical protein